MEPNSYYAKRFEDYMAKVDAGELTQALALTALREEIEYAEQQELSDGKETAK